MNADAVVPGCLSDMTTTPVRPDEDPQTHPYVEPGDPGEDTPLAPSPQPETQPDPQQSGTPS